MNKDVIYIEPEDDITDIITKIENAKEKIVALVPPSQANVLKSIVNIKLIAKAGFAADKTIVLVTTEPAIVKLAAVTRMPVTKNLQSAPVIPEVNPVDAEKIQTEAEAEVIETDEDDKEVEAAEVEEAEELAEEAKSEKPEKVEEEAGDGAEEEAEEAEKPAKAEKKSKKPAKLSENPVVRFVQEHKKLTIGGGIGAFILILVLIWAFAIAPAVTVAVTIRANKSPFSEAVSFSFDLEGEDAATGKFYLEENKIETTTEVTFEATGEKNVGEKARGELIIYAFLSPNQSISVSSGSTFKLSGLAFTSTSDATLTWDESTTCGNSNQLSIATDGCLVYKRVAVVAEEAGDKYNVAASDKWETSARIRGAYSEKAMTGGTDKVITVVSQADVDKALEKVESSSEAVNREQLLSQINTEEKVVISSSFKQTTADPVVTPKIGEEVDDDEKPKLSVTTTDVIYSVDKAKVEEFITTKTAAAMAESQKKIYSIVNPFIESFMETENGFTGRLKATYYYGPVVTEKDVAELIRGKGLGEAVNEISSAYKGSLGEQPHLVPSFFWVYTVPNDVNKITVSLEVKVEE